MSKSKLKKHKIQEDVQKDGYVVVYDTSGDGLMVPPHGLYVAWGEEELKDEAMYVFNEIRDDGYTLDDIVVLKIDTSKKFKLNSKETVKTEIEETLEIAI